HDPKERAGADLLVDGSKQGAAPMGNEVVEHEVGHAVLRESRRVRNTGAPMTAQTAPVCTTTDTDVARAMVSAMTRKSAPPAIDRGSSKECFAPMSRRTACGTTSPTKLMMPETATAAPVTSEAMRSRSSRLR